MDTKKKRILIFSLVYYPRFVGGAEVAVKEITDRISPDEVEFDMVTLRKQAPAFEKIGNVSIYRVGRPWQGRNTKSSRIFPLSKIMFPWLACRKALELHRTKPYDAVWPIMASYAGFAAFMFKRRYPQVPMILTIQEGDHFERREGVFGKFFRKIFAAADRVQAISKYLADWSRHMGATCPVEVIPNGANVELFSKTKSPAELDELEKKLGKKDGDTFLVTTSRLVMKNGVGDVIDALQYLPASVKFLVIGNGALESELKNKVAQLKLGDRVIFTGFIAHNDMPPYLHISDIFVRPSLSEGLGNSFLEAMAAGLPVIATPVGGIPDFLKDGETGLFCEVNNPRSIAQKVEKLIKDREAREYIVKNARHMVETTYQWQGIAVQMKALFESARLG